MKRFWYHGKITMEGVRNAQVLINEAVKAGDPEVTLCLCSGGGDVLAGTGLFHYLRMVPLSVHTHAVGNCASIAATVFMAGARRTVSPMTVFSLHAARYSEGPLLGQIAPNTAIIAAPFSALGWSDDEVSSRFSTEDFRFDPDEAVRLRVADAVEDLAFNAGDEIINIRIPGSE